MMHHFRRNNEKGVQDVSCAHMRGDWLTVYVTVVLDNVVIVPF